jgi:hypothetical protein
MHQGFTVSKDGNFAQAGIADLIDLTELAYREFATMEQKGSDRSTVGYNRHIFSGMLFHQSPSTANKSLLELGKCLTTTTW